MNEPSDPVDEGPSQPFSSASRTRRAKWLAALFSFVTIAGVAYPVIQNWREEPQDSFPLSYYPMFTHKRKPEQPVTYFVGIDKEGHEHKLHYRFLSKGGMNQVRRQMGKMVKDGDAETVCKRVAKNVARSNEDWLAKVVTIEVRTDTYNLENYFTTTNRIPLKRKVHCTCAVQSTK
jgi:hypothetical protein